MDISNQIKLIGLIYESIQSREVWQDFLKTLVEFINLRSANITTVNIKTGEVCAYFEGGESLLPGYRESYATEFALEDEVMRLALESDPGTLINHRDMKEQQFRRIEESRFFKEWAYPQGIYTVIAVNISIEGDWRTMFMLQRTEAQGWFSEEEKKFVSDLFPHMQRASQLISKVRENQMLSANTYELLRLFPFGVAIANDMGKVYAANEKADKLLKDARLLFVNEQRLQTKNKRLSADINNAILSVVQSARNIELSHEAVYCIPIGDAYSPYIILSIIPFISNDFESGSHAILYFYEPKQDREPNKQVIANLWNLTPAEVNLCCDLVKGLSLIECVKTQHKSRETLKGYLKNIFQKTGSRRQAELVAMILTSPAMF